MDIKIPGNIVPFYEIRQCTNCCVSFHYSLGYWRLNEISKRAYILCKECYFSLEKAKKGGDRT